MTKRYLITEAQYTEVINHLNLIESEEEKKEIINEQKDELIIKKA